MGFLDPAPWIPLPKQLLHATVELDVSKETAANIYFDVGYVGSKGTNLTLGFDGNRPIQRWLPRVRAFRTLASRRPLCRIQRHRHGEGDRQFHLPLAPSANGAARRQRAFPSRRLHLVSQHLSNSDISTVGGGTLTWAAFRII